MRRFVDYDRKRTHKWRDGNTSEFAGKAYLQVLVCGLDSTAMEYTWDLPQSEHRRINRRRQAARALALYLNDVCGE